ncbi:hypothetical protein COV16_00750 [Candidatus Woesearchaeota archaeon CG10_big_fil_rev_8_21_14_0_10_34_8]|nr:MAG: hypothetical protein COV16_00750 [Candidatus Woesearchaeota archaeon CG10_big_fil_rev_8_21_14_0_10_34_8]
MTIIQLVGIIFAIFALSRVFLRYKDKSISAFELIFWSIVWMGVVTVALFPDIFTSLSKLLGIGRGVDTLLYVGMIVLFYLMFRLYVKIEGQQKDITKLVREIAIEKQNNKNKKCGNKE